MRRFKTAVFLLGVFFDGCLLHGCSIVTKNQGEVGIRYGTEITFFSRAAQTAPEPSTVTTTLDDRLMPAPRPEPIKDEPEPPTP